MSEDILHRKRLETSDMTFDSTSEISNYTLVIIEILCLCMANKPLQDLGMPSPNRTAAVSTCVELDHEQSYSTSDCLCLCYSTNLYKQIVGIPMVGNANPFIADLFLSQLEYPSLV